MKCFICTADNINIGIPARLAERIVSVMRVQSVVCETEDGQAFVSLPVLLKLKDCAVHHGLILKSGVSSPHSQTSALMKTLLLTARIGIELDIPEENIYPLTSALEGMNRYFSGVCFVSGEMILILDPQKLTDGIII